MVATTPVDRVPDLVARALHGRSGTRWIGIDGLGAAGKTTLAARVAERLGGAVVSVDDFAGPQIPTWDHSRFRDQVLRPLLAGRPARYGRADVLTGAISGCVEVPVGVPVVVEGVSATDTGVGVPWDLTVWVEVPVDERRRRILARDSADLLDRWRAEWWPREEALRTWAAAAAAGGPRGGGAELTPAAAPERLPLLGRSVVVPES